MVHRDELELEGTQLQGVALDDLVVDGLAQAVLPQLAVEKRQRQLRADQRDVAPLAQEVRRRPDVVLVTVGQHQGLDVVEAVPDGVEVRKDQVDPRVVVLGEEHATVHDQQPSGVLEDGHVAPDIPETAEGGDAQAPRFQWWRGGQVGVRVAHSGPSSGCQRTGWVPCSVGG